MFLHLFFLLQPLFLLNAVTLWCLTLGITTSKKKDRLALWAIRFSFGLLAVLNTLLFVSTLL